MPGGVMGLFARRPRRVDEADAKPGVAPPPAATATPGAAKPCAPAREDLLLVVENLCKSYGGVKPAQDISFCLRRDACADRPQWRRQEHADQHAERRGSARQRRDPLSRRRHRRRAAHAICALGVGRSFQNLRLFGELSVLDNVLLGRHSRMTNGFWVSLLGLPGARAGTAGAGARP